MEIMAGNRAVYHYETGKFDLVDDSELHLIADGSMSCFVQAAQAFGDPSKTD